MRAQAGVGASVHPGRTLWLNRLDISGEVHVGACTPLVTDVIGTSSTGTSGHSPENMARLTSPWSLDTPLAAPDRRSPMTAMLNGASGGSPGSWPSSMRASTP